MDAKANSIRVGGWILTPDPEARTRNAGTKFERAEELRRFAEARSHQAMVALHDDAQRKAPPHMEALQSNPGMAISTRTGNLVTHMGFEAAVEQIAVVQSVPAWVAERSLNRAEALSTDLGEVLEALSEGRIGPEHVEVIADQALRITARAVAAPDEADPAAVETWFRTVAAEERAVKKSRNELGRKLLQYAGGRNPSALRAKAKRLLEKYDPESFTKRSRKAIDARFFRVDPGSDGMAYLTVALESPKAEAIYDRVHRQARVLKESADGESPEERTMDQLRTDVFGDHMLMGPRGSGLENVHAQVTITVPAACLAGVDVDALPNGTQPAGTLPDSVIGIGVGPGGAAERLLPPGTDLPSIQRLGPMDEESAGILMANAASWWRILTDPLNGAVIDWAHERYRPTPAQRRALAHRDHGCRTPGCNRPAARCEPDHTIEWQDGGTTDLANLALLCKRCHRLKSLGILSMEQLPDGTIVVTTLWGTSRESAPEAPWSDRLVAARTRSESLALCTPLSAPAGAGTQRRGHPATADVAGRLCNASNGEGAGNSAIDSDGWDPWDGPAPQPPPEVAEALNAELFARADRLPEVPAADPEEVAASWLVSQQAAETQAELDFERWADSNAWDAAGGEDLAWMIAELETTDHTPQRDPRRLRPRNGACTDEPTRPRVRSMRKRRPLASGAGATCQQTPMRTVPAHDPWAVWNAASTPDPSGTPPPF
jgi:hypothetical protein